MDNKTQYFFVEENKIFKSKMLNWANRFNIFCFLDNCNYNFQTPKFDSILAAGAVRTHALEVGSAYEGLQNFYDEKPSWLFGHLSYDLKNEIDNLTSSKYDNQEFGLGFFFEPEILIHLNDSKLSISSQSQNADVIFQEILSTSACIESNANEIKAKAATTKQEYIKKIDALQNHILMGDCYEINFCQYFFAENANVNPIFIFNYLLQKSPAPFAALYKWEHRYCISASPERFLKKEGDRLISQPMKGTARRNIEDQSADNLSKDQLGKNQKEKSENVMIVDLVRNDLSRVCNPGSVSVDEIFGIYSFTNVHQMISTVSGLAKNNVSFTDIIKATFPMGSMTGAPKKSVMELIDKYESANRGLFSGSIGYIEPSGDFDFSVVIRSIFYNSSKKLLEFFAGGGITFYSDAEKEWEELNLKIERINDALKASNI